MPHQLALTAPLTLTQRLVLGATSLFGWQFRMEEPLPSRCVIIGAPHTTNWDLLAALVVRGASGMPINWIAKDAIFKGPGNWFFRKLGGIPVNRRSKNNFVEQMVALFAEKKEMILAIAPQGTRSVQTHWRSGFYYMAMGAKVPIALGYADYVKKIVGIGPIMQPSGDLQADFERIKAFYADIVGRHPHLNGEIQPQEKKESATD